MKAIFFSAFGFICLLFGKCVAFSAETSNHFLFYLSPKESKLLSPQEFPLVQETPSLFKKYGVDKYGKKYAKVILQSTYAVGRDVLYQGGGALAYYLHPNICVKTGPSWCKDIGIDRKWKWAMQLNYEIPFAQ